MILPWSFLEAGLYKKWEDWSGRELSQNFITHISTRWIARWLDELTKRTTMNHGRDKNWRIDKRNDTIPWDHEIWRRRDEEASRRRYFFVGHKVEVSARRLDYFVRDLCWYKWLFYLHSLSLASLPHQLWICAHLCRKNYLLLGKYCSDPGVAQFTRRDEQEKKTGFKTKTVLHYYCIPNYKLEGRATITCKDNGQWSNPTPKCLRMYFFKPISLYIEQIEYSVVSWILRHETIFYSFIAPSCSSPILPLNSRVALPAQYNSSSGGTLGTRLVLSCESGYYRVGDSSFMTCNASGQWQISKSFQCRRKYIYSSQVGEVKMSCKPFPN